MWLRRVDKECKHDVCGENSYNGRFENYIKSWENNIKVDFKD
jgi:hypothetical protein